MVLATAGLVGQHTSTLLGTINKPANSYAHEAGHWLELNDNYLSRFAGISIMGYVETDDRRNVIDIDVMALIDCRLHNV